GRCLIKFAIDGVQAGDGRRVHIWLISGGYWCDDSKKASLSLPMITRRGLLIIWRPDYNRRHE
ncbi:MAG: hypothetical protein KC708_03350, partial [Anaerolineae bacterium]|nr:hypothetical protein [Anaerolineae bacterium]